MSERSATHATFALERTYDFPPPRVFRAWAEPEQKARWFGPRDRAGGEHTLDFRPGGSEHFTVALESGMVYSYDARYWEIVEHERIVSSYDMHRDQTRISVSLATVEFCAVEGGATMLKLTEQGVFLDGEDTPEQREAGTRDLLEALAGTLAQAPR